MLVYRFFRGCRLFPLKIIHGVIQISALVFAAVGVAAAFEHHNRSDINNMYSLHSWIGLITVIVFGLQVLYFFLSTHRKGRYAMTMSFYLSVCSSVA